MTAWILCLGVLVCGVTNAQVETGGMAGRVRAGGADSLHGMQAPEAGVVAPAWYEMVTNVPGDWGRAAQGLWSTETIPYLGGVAATTAALMLIDQKSYNSSRDLRSRSAFIRKGADYGVRAGDGLAHVGVAAGFALYGFAAKDARALRTGSQTVESLLATGILVQIMKRMSGRESPLAATRGGGTWAPFSNLKEYERHQSRFFSFPSGHIATTMSTVTVIAENYPEVGWIRPVGYTIVGVVGFSLVNAGLHWYSDLPTGIVLGYAFGKIVSHRNDAGTAGAGGSGPTLTVIPSMQSTGTGITMLVAF